MTKISHLQVNKADKAEFEDILRRIGESEQKFEGIERLLILRGGSDSNISMMAGSYDAEVVKAMGSKMELLWKKIAEMDKEIADIKKLISSNVGNSNKNTVNF